MCAMAKARREKKRYVAFCRDKIVRVMHPSVKKKLTMKQMTVTYMNELELLEEYI